MPVPLEVENLPHISQTRNILWILRKIFEDSMSVHIVKEKETGTIKEVKVLDSWRGEVIDVLLVPECSNYFETCELTVAMSDY